MSRAGLDRLTPLATPTLILAANLPDIDTITLLFGQRSYFHHHRGITHSLVGLLVLAILLSLTVHFYDRRVRLKNNSHAKPTRPSRLFVVSLLGLLSHLLLDYTNNYGVRPWLPFDGSWYTADIVFIADPWLWLILGGALFVLTANNFKAVAFWSLLATALSLLLFYSRVASSIPRAAQVAWFIGLALVLLIRISGAGRPGSKPAIISLILTVLYWLSLTVSHGVALERARASFAARLPGEPVVSISAFAMPANPFNWRCIVETPTTIHMWNESVLKGATGPAASSLYYKPQDRRLLQQIEATATGKVFLNFARHTQVEIKRDDSGYSVHMRDLRFNLTTHFLLDNNLNVIAEGFGSAPERSSFRASVDE